MTARVALIQADACELLALRQQMLPAVFTSLPDAAEVGMDVADWLVWYRSTMRLTLGSIAPGGVGVIAATDRRAGGGIESKAAVILGAADDLRLRLLWHKIVVVTRGTGLRRPSYTHMIAVANGGRVTAGRPTPDVLDGGPKEYANSLGRDAIAVALDLVERFGPDVLADPFVGRGSIVVAAADRGIPGLGVDIDADQIGRALMYLGTRGQRISLDDYLWT